MDSLAIFEFDNQEIRFVDGLPVANDVAKVLGYADPAKTISTKVRVNNKGVARMVTPGGIQKVAVLKEAGIYQLIFSSKLPSAEAFQDWVFEEVLPSLRKDGKYELKNRKGKSQEYVLERQESIQVRRTLTDSIKDYITRHPELSDNAKKFLYSNSSEALNLGIFSKKAKALKEVIGISNSSQLRDYLDTSEVICIKTVEYLACQLIDIKDIYPCDAVKQAIDMSLTSKRFASKYSALVKA